MLFFPIGVVLMGAEDDRGVLWVCLTVNWDWILINRKSIRKVVIRNVDWDSPGPPSSSKHGASRDDQTQRYSIRAEQKNPDQDYRFICIPIPFKQVTIWSYSSSDINIFLKIHRESKEHYPAHTNVITAPGIDSFIMLEHINNVMLAHMEQ
jgi:hypothetical protein